MDHDGKEGCRRGDHERYLHDQMIAECIDVQQGGADVGGTHLLSVVLNELWIRLHTRDQDAPEHQISRPGYSSRSLLQLVGTFEDRGRCGSLRVEAEGGSCSGKGISDDGGGSVE